MKIVLKNALIDYHLSCEWTSGLLKESINLLAPREAVGSLAVTANAPNRSNQIRFNLNLI